MSSKPFKLHAPQSLETGVVFASPHSGRDYPWSFLRASILDEKTIRSSEDAFVDMLFDGVPAMGAPLLTATMPRAYLDLNRSAEELDPALIAGVKGVTHNPRVSSGLGVIPRVVANGRAIYRGKLEMDEARERIADYWHPYHRALQGQLDQAKARFGTALLIDCHSMPHEAIESAAGRGPFKPEVVLGDRFGAACSGEIMERVEAAFAATGLRVARNAPFAGAFVTQHYGRPARNQHVIQVEIDRSLYMNEAAIRPNARFAAFKRTLSGVIAEIVEIGRGQGMSLAAE
ncbi:N-formylglutamate amidohydrolase [Alphaproteobacteria bacterium KMM 3653]|uniref:N-formylglutamate amidohydrolase n=1 Tax=Harenicola maris TaxID=2841044 RepID=A0AAP2G471_9RHOB|nr:N-formylglutamate amidohydrolase [Harenicola maris]